MRQRLALTDPKAGVLLLKLRAIFRTGRRRDSELSDGQPQVITASMSSDFIAVVSASHNPAVRKTRTTIAELDLALGALLGALLVVSAQPVMTEQPQSRTNVPA